jgi:hypothetical protein
VNVSFSQDLQFTDQEEARGEAQEHDQNGEKGHPDSCFAELLTPLSGLIRRHINTKICKLRGSSSSIFNSLRISRKRSQAIQVEFRFPPVALTEPDQLPSLSLICLRTPKIPGTAPESSDLFWEDFWQGRSFLDR